MVAKLVISLDGQQIDVVSLSKDVMTIGRNPSNDIYIESSAISGFHAKFITILSDSFLEDLGSTNGTAVNGMAIHKHALKHGDEISIGLHSLTYDNPKTEGAPADLNSTMIIKPDSAAGLKESKKIDDNVDKENLAKVSTGSVTPREGQAGHLQILTGNNSGKKLGLTKALTTVGKPDGNSAAISYRPDGYYIMMIEGKDGIGENPPTLNNGAISTQATKLTTGDIVAIGGTKLEFNGA